MIIDCISDLHGFYPELESGDLLIVAGDLTARDTELEYFDLWQWLSDQKYKKIIIIAGNHDMFLEKNGDPLVNPGVFSYLCDSGTEFDGLKIWGSPWTPYFHGVNPNCAGFMKPDEELEEYWEKIPLDTDILITHNPPHMFLDKVNRFSPKGQGSSHAGSRSLFLRCAKMTNLKYHIFGHIHESYGKMRDGPVTFINCSHVNEKYEPVNNPIRIEI